MFILALTLILSAFGAISAFAATGNLATKTIATDDLAAAQELFKRGEFAQSKALCLKLHAENEKQPTLLKTLGAIALFENRLSDAQIYLQAAKNLAPTSSPLDTALYSMLAETWYRQDKFSEAAQILRSIGRTAFAEALESFGGGVTARKPYTIANGMNSEVVVKFVQTDPLPIVHISVNGSADALFIIDTGGGALILDPDFAKKVGAVEFGAETGTFAAGKKVPVRHGRVDSVRLGGLTLQNIPINILDTKKFSIVTGGKPVSGVLGTVLLYHFLATLDYPKGELVLKQRIKPDVATKTYQSENTFSMPFWMSGDHFITVRGRVEESPEMLFFVDTGLAGAGFTCPESTLKEANIVLPGGDAQTGIGGGGAVSILPFTIKKLSIGAVKAENILALAGPFPKALEYSQGYRIGGLVSHSIFRPYAVTFDFDTLTLTMSK
jgi:Aspartyl protease